MDDLIEREGCDGRRERSAVEDTEVLLGLERDGGNVVLCEGFGGRHDFARVERRRAVVDTNRGVADEGSRDV